MRRTRFRYLSALLPLAFVACQESSGPRHDDEVFGTYTLRRANGEALPAKVLETTLAGGGIVTYAESGSFRISENGTWAFAFHFRQVAIDPDDQISYLHYDVEDAGTYSLQGERITLDGSVPATLTRDGVLTYTVAYNVPGAAPTSVAYEFTR